MNRITPFLWYDGQLQEALDLYRAVFANFTVLDVKAGQDGALMSATFEIEGQQLIAFNGGPGQAFTPAISLYVNCETQTEVDEIWSKLLEHGGRESGCGWLQDRFGLSWQIIPAILPKLLTDPDPARAARALNAMLRMRRIDIAALERAVAAEEIGA